MLEDVTGYEKTKGSAFEMLDSVQHRKNCLRFRNQSYGARRRSGGVVMWIRLCSIIAIFRLQEKHRRNLSLFALAVAVIAPCLSAAAPRIDDTRTESAAVQQQTLADLIKERDQALASGKYEAAVDRQRDIVEIAEGEYGRDSPAAATQRADLSQLQRVARLPDQSRSQLKTIASLLDALSATKDEQVQYPQLCLILEKVPKVWDLIGYDSILGVRILYHVAIAAQSARLWSIAEICFEKAAERVPDVYGIKEHPDQALAIDGLARTLQAQGQWEAAIAHYQRAAGLFESTAPYVPEKAITSRVASALLLAYRGEVSEANAQLTHIDVGQLNTCSVECRVRYATALAETRLLRGDEDGVADAWEPFLTVPANATTLVLQQYRAAAVLRLHYLLRLGRWVAVEREGSALLDSWENDPTTVLHELRLIPLVVEALLAQHKSPAAVAKRAANLTSRDMGVDGATALYYEAWANDCERRFDGRMPVFPEKPLVPGGVFANSQQHRDYWLLQGKTEKANFSGTASNLSQRLNSARAATFVVALASLQSSQIPSSRRLHERRSISELRRFLRMESPKPSSSIATARAETTGNMSERDFNEIETFRLAGDYVSAADVARLRATETQKMLGVDHWHIRTLLELADGLEWVSHQPDHALNRIATAEHAMSQISQNWQQNPSVALAELLGHLEVLQLYATNQLPLIRGLRVAASIAEAMGYQHLAYAWYTDAVEESRSRFGDGPMLATVIAQAGDVSRSGAVRTVAYSDLESAWDLIKRITGSPQWLRMHLAVTLAQHDLDWGYPREALRWLDAVPQLADSDRIRELVELAQHPSLAHEQTALMLEMAPRVLSAVTRAAALRLLGHWDAAAVAIASADPVAHLPWAMNLAVEAEKGMIDVARGRYDVAIPSLNNVHPVVKLFGRVGWNEHRAILAGLASVAIAGGEWDRAEKLLHEAAISESRDSDDERPTLVRAEFAVVRGRLVEAESSLRYALDHCETSFGQQSLRTAEVDVRLAEVLLTAGNVESARFYATRALRTYTKHKVLDHPAAVVAKLLRKIADSGESYTIGSEVEDTLLRLEAVLGKTHPTAIKERLRLGNLALHAGQLGAAERHAHLASQSALVNGVWGRIALAEARAILAEVYRREGRTLEARALFESVLAVETPLERARLPLLQTRLAATLIDGNPTQEQRPRVRRLLEDAIAKQERSRQSVAGDELDRAQFGKVFGAQLTFRTLARLELLDARDAPRALTQARAKSFGLIERSRGRALEELASGSGENLLALAKRIVADSEQVEVTDIASLNRKYLGPRVLTLIEDQRRVSASYDAFDLLNRRYDMKSEPLAERFVTEHFQERAKLRAFYRKLKSLLAEYRVSPQESLSYENVVSRLYPGELLILYDLAETGGLVFLLDHSGQIDVEHLVGNGGGPVGLGTIRHAARSAFALIRSGADASDKISQLSKWLLPPIVTRRIESSRRVLLVPDGPLHNLPFEILQLGSAGSWLENGPPIAIGASASILLRARPKKHKTMSGGRLVMLGDPRFNLDSVSGATTRGGLDEKRVAAERGIYGNLPRLPGTRAEINAIVTLFRNSTEHADIKAIGGEDATLPILFSEMRKVKYLHLATHGESFGGNRVFDSALILAPSPTVDVEAPAGSKSGLLRLGSLLAAEWGGRLDGCELVVLSACKTGIGESMQAEGMLALPWGFLSAGANTVIATRWNVSDFATALLMKRFYANLWGQVDESRTVAGHVFPPLQPMPKTEALHEAKHWLFHLSRPDAETLWRSMTDMKGPLVTDRSALSFSDEPKAGFGQLKLPRYWAAFTLIADPGEMPPS